MMTGEHLSKFTSTYLKKFFSRKNLAPEEWEVNINGEIKLIKNTQVIEQILAASPAEQSALAEALQELEANHYDINQFLKNLVQQMNQNN